MLFDIVSATVSVPVDGRAVIWRLGHRLLLVLIYSLALMAGTVMAVAERHVKDAKPGTPEVQRELLLQMPLPDFPGRIVTALTIELAPGEVVGPHRHGGFVYVYLLQGRIRSQLEGEDPVEYSAGQSWTEPADVLHRRTENPSASEPAKFLAVIYSGADAVITRPELDDH